MPLRELFPVRGTADRRAVSGCAAAAEGDLRVVLNIVVIDVEEADVEAFAQFHGAGDRSGNDRSGKAVFGLVLRGRTASPSSATVVTHATGPEDFLAKAAHGGCDFAEHRGAIEQSFVCVPPARETCAAVYRIGHDGMHRIHLPLADQGAERDWSFGGIADRKMLRFVGEAIKQRVGYFSRGENAAGCHADLALMQPILSESGVRSREIESGIIEHDHGILSAELKRDVFQMFAAELADTGVRPLLSR